MSADPRVLYVHHAGAGERIRRAIECAEIEPIEATSGLDALKRLEYEPVAAVVVPAELPDVPTETFVGRLDASMAAGPCIVVGELDRVPGPVIQVGSEVSVESLSERIERAIRDRRVGDAFDRHDRLKNAFLRVAGAMDDPETIERVLHDALADLGVYRFVALGRCDPDDGTIDLDHPFSRRTPIADVGTVVAGADRSSVRHAIEGATVTQTTLDPGPVRGFGSAGSTTDGGEFVLTVVPLVDSGRTIGVVLLVADSENAPDGAERALLERIGRLCGLVLGREGGDQDGSSDRSAARLGTRYNELRRELVRAAMSLEIAREGDLTASLDRLETALDRIGALLDAAPNGAGHVDEPVEAEVHRAVVDVWPDVRTPDVDLVIAEPVSVAADPTWLRRLLSVLLRGLIESAGRPTTVRVGGLPGGRGFYVEGNDANVEREARGSVHHPGETVDSGGPDVELGPVREIAADHDWRVSVAQAGTDGGIRVEVNAIGERSGPRDELSTLFSDDAGEFVFGTKEGRK